MLEKSGIKRKIAIFSTFAVVLLIGMAFVPAAEGRPDEREPLPEPKPGEERKIEAAQEIELKEGQLHLPEEEAKRIGMSQEEIGRFQRDLAEANILAEKGYLEFEKNGDGEIEIRRTEKTGELIGENIVAPMSGGSNWYSSSTGWTSTEHELGLNAFWTAWLADYGTIGVMTLASILGILTKGAALPVLAVIAGAMLSVGLTYAENQCEGSGVIWTFEDYHWTPHIDSTSVEPQ